MTLAWFVLHAFKIGIACFKGLLREYADTNGGFLVKSSYRTVGEKQNRFSKSSRTYGETLREYGTLLTSPGTFLPSGETASTNPLALSTIAAPDSTVCPCNETPARDSK